jgi:hypothetical protein
MSGVIEHGREKLIAAGLHAVHVGLPDHDPRKDQLPRHLLSYEHAKPVLPAKEKSE